MRDSMGLDQSDGVIIDTVEPASFAERHSACMKAMCWWRSTGSRSSPWRTPNAYAVR